MKWYSHKAYKMHMEDLKHFKDDQELRAVYQDWAKVISNRFERSYPRIGILNLQDLLQEGYVGFYKAWPKLNWKLINDSPEPERIGMITNYIKLAIKRHIVRAISRDRETIRIPEHYYKQSWNNGTTTKEYETDIFLTRTFASFFTPDYLDIADDGGDYVADQLNEFLNDVMDLYLTRFEKTVLKQYYGIDEPNDQKKAVKRIAESCSKSQIWIKKTKGKALKKLQDKEVMEIIKNNIENIYT